MLVQLPPVASQRCHWSLKLIGWVPVHVPWLTVSVAPSFVVPMIVGAAVFFGAWPVAAATPVGRDVATPLPEPFVALPVRAGFSYRKKKGRREYVRVTLARRPDGSIEASKYPQDGAGILSSLTESAGLVELDEDTTRVEPGQQVGFLPHASLIG